MSPSRFTNERRRGLITSDFILRAFAAWLLIAALQFLVAVPGLRAMRFPDPDDVMRLVQVRDWLGGQGWFDLTQHRVSPPQGVAMHWSRLVDLPIALPIVLLTPVVGQALAEAVAVTLVPLITLLLAVVLAGRIAWRLLDEESAGLACLAIGLASPVMAQMRPLRIDHHGWQVVLLLGAVNGLMARRSRTGGLIVGLCLAVGLSISLEALPMTAAIMGLLALRWLTDPAERGWFVAGSQALCAGSVGLFLATRGVGDLANHCDALSPIYLAGFALLALSATLLAAPMVLPRAAIAGGLLLAAGGVIASVASLTPGCLAGPFGGLDPVVRAVWLNNVAEGLPLWRQNPATAAQIVLPPLFGVIAALRLAERSGDWLRRWWLEYAFLLGAALLFACLVARGGAVACALAAPPIGWQLHQWLRQLRTGRSAKGRIAAATAMLASLAPGFPVMMLGAVAPATATAQSPLPAPAGRRASACEIDVAGPALSRLKDAIIFAPVDIGPRLLYVSQVKVVATGHHRAGPAIRQVVDGFSTKPEAARLIVGRTGASYLAICPELAESGLYAARSPGGLAHALRAGRVPFWLEPVELPATSGLKLYRIKG